MEIAMKNARLHCKLKVITDLDSSAGFLPLLDQFAVGITIASVEFLEYKF